MKIREIIHVPGENPVSYAERLGEYIDGRSTVLEKRRTGQYFTPAGIANLMAEKTNLRSGLSELRILDAGAGTGILSCAFVLKLAEVETIKKIELLCIEKDEETSGLLEIALEYLKGYLRREDLDLVIRIEIKDFIEEAKEIEEYAFDLIISNPPYYKISTGEDQNGNKNIYSLFLTGASKLLANEGEMIFLIPRSFCSGSGYKEERRKLLDGLMLEKIHLIEKASESFNISGMLTDLVIINGRKTTSLKDEYLIEIKSSPTDVNTEFFSYKWLYNNTESILPLAKNASELEVVTIINSYEKKLKDYGIKHEMGRLTKTDFNKYRTDEINNDGQAGVIMQGDFSDTRSIKTYGRISIGETTKRFLIENKNYVLVKNYNTYDNLNKIITLPYLKRSIATEFIALENKLSILFSDVRELSIDEVIEISIILNSRLYNDYARIINGNINLIPKEILELPVKLKLKALPF